IQSDVKKFAVEHGLPVLQPVKLRDPEFLSELKKMGAELFVVIEFRMLPEAVWAMPPKGTFNLHASLLPRYRGAAPINWAIMNGDTLTGVTTFFLSHEIDTGDIIAQREEEIRPEDNIGTLYDRLMLIGAEMTSETVRDIEAGTVTTRPQPEGEFVPAPKIFKDTCHIDWNRPAVDIHNQVRGLSPYPAAWSIIQLDNGSSLETKIFDTRVLSPENIAEDWQYLASGSVIESKKRLLVKTGNGVLEILSLQPSGKRRMETSAFLLGYHPVKFLSE
ncbi:MAG: methionyl-tRNA formyltransferase, partial [Muribaculaceae bacterium]|nr:methionyl-tRNA formyltransferase [Muribaculaceae bacterium]